MKRLTFAIALAIAVTVSGAPDVLQQLSVSKADAVQDVLSALANGSPNYHRVRQGFKAANPAARAALVEQVMAWTKAYVSSAQFGKDYAAYREQAKPTAPEAGQSVDAELAAQKREHDQALAEMKAALKDMPPEMRKEMEKTIRETEKAFKEMQNDSEFQSGQREQIELERKGVQDQYKEDVKRWNEEYPADPRVLVKQRLRDFLAATENVDYDAKLVARGSKMRFASDAYEGKEWSWKLAYRAGKPATEAARAFAKGWLAELR